MNYRKSDVTSEVAEPASNEPLIETLAKALADRREDGGSRYGASRALLQGQLQVPGMLDRALVARLACGTVPAAGLVEIAHGGSDPAGQQWEMADLDGQ